MHTHTQSHIHISAYTSTTYICTDTTTQQYAAQYNTENNRTHSGTEPQHNTPDTDRTQNNLSTEQDTENSTQPQHRCITYDLHKYSFDLYHEYIAINNSNTIELYTILQD